MKVFDEIIDFIYFLGIISNMVIIIDDDGEHVLSLIGDIVGEVFLLFYFILFVIKALRVLYFVLIILHHS